MDTIAVKINLGMPPFLKINIQNNMSWEQIISSLNNLFGEDNYLNISYIVHNKVVYYEEDFNLLPVISNDDEILIINK